jgi:hypothetical protein
MHPLHRRFAAGMRAATGGGDPTLIHHWDFSAGSGSIVHDQVGSNDINLFGAYDWVSDANGSGVRFNSSGEETGYGALSAGISAFASEITLVLEFIEHATIEYAGFFYTRTGGYQGIQQSNSTIPGSLRIYRGGNSPSNATAGYTTDVLVKMALGVFIGTGTDHLYVDGLEKWIWASISTAMLTSGWVLNSDPAVADRKGQRTYYDIKVFNTQKTPAELAALTS